MRKPVTLNNLLLLLLSALIFSGCANHQFSPQVSTSSPVEAAGWLALGLAMEYNSDSGPRKSCQQKTKAEREYCQQQIAEIRSRIADNSNN